MKTEQNPNPHNPDAEDKVIASCLLPGDTSIFDSVSAIVTADDFYTQKGRIVFEAISKLASEDKPLDEISLQEALKGTDGLDVVGGVPGILALMDCATTELQAVHCAKLIAEKSNLRSLIRHCRIAREDAETESIEFKDIRSKLESGITEIDSKDSKELTIGESVDEIVEDIRRIKSGEFVSKVVRTGIDELDGFLGSGGIAPGEVFTLAAPTSCGKSAFALYLAITAMQKQEVPVAYFSLEMPQKQLVKRMIQSLSGVNHKSIEDGSATPTHEVMYHKATKDVRDLKLYTSHQVSGADDLASQCRYLVRKKGVRMIVIDYLQLIPFGSGKISKCEGIANISHKIKQIAIDLDVAIILLAQVNREGAKRDGGLSIYDLKDSGDIENDADVVFMMWPYKDDVDASKGSDDRGPYTGLYYKLAKNREGERDIGGFLKFYHCTGRFA